MGFTPGHINYFTRNIAGPLFPVRCSSRKVRSFRSSWNLWPRNYDATLACCRFTCDYLKVVVANLVNRYLGMIGPLVRSIGADEEAVFGHCTTNWFVEYSNEVEVVFGLGPNPVIPLAGFLAVCRKSDEF